MQKAKIFLRTNDKFSWISLFILLLSTTINGMRSSWKAKSSLYILFFSFNSSKSILLKWYSVVQLQEQPIEKGSREDLDCFCCFIFSRLFSLLIILRRLIYHCVVFWYYLIHVNIAHWWQLNQKLLLIIKKMLSKTSSIHRLCVILLDECHGLTYLCSQADCFYAFNKIIII